MPTSPQNGDINICFMRFPLSDEYKPILKLANFRLLKLWAQWVLSVTIPPLVGGINNTKDFIHYIHNVSLGY